MTPRLSQRHSPSCSGGTIVFRVAIRAKDGVPFLHCNGHMVFGRLPPINLTQPTSQRSLKRKRKYQLINLQHTPPCYGVEIARPQCLLRSSQHHNRIPDSLVLARHHSAISSPPSQEKPQSLKPLKQSWLRPVCTIQAKRVHTHQWARADSCLSCPDIFTERTEPHRVHNPIAHSLDKIPKNTLSTVVAIAEISCSSGAFHSGDHLIMIAGHYCL